jgi:hypothetical protein
MEVPTLTVLTGYSNDNSAHSSQLFGNALLMIETIHFSFIFHFLQPSIVLINCFYCSDPP